MLEYRILRILENCFTESILNKHTCVKRFIKKLLTISFLRSIIKHNKLTKGVPTMRKNHSFDYLYHIDVNFVHVLSHGFIADGKNGYCENFELG